MEIRDPVSAAATANDLLRRLESIKHGLAVEIVQARALAQYLQVPAESEDLSNRLLTSARMAIMRKNERKDG